MPTHFILKTVYKFIFTTLLMLLIFLGLAYLLMMIDGLLNSRFVGPLSVDEQVILFNKCLFIALIFGLVEVARIILRSMKANELRNETLKN